MGAWAIVLSCLFGAVVVFSIIGSIIAYCYKVYARKKAQKENESLTQATEVVALQEPEFAEMTVAAPQPERLVPVLPIPPQQWVSASPSVGKSESEETSGVIPLSPCSSGSDDNGPLRDYGSMENTNYHDDFAKAQFPPATTDSGGLEEVDEVSLGANPPFGHHEDISQSIVESH